MGARGYGDGFNAGMVIGLPPILNFAKEPLRTKVLEEVFNGEKVSTCHVCIRGPKAVVAWHVWQQGRDTRDGMLMKKVISLAISEAFAGSDVAGLRTTAVKSKDGKSW